HGGETVVLHGSFNNWSQGLTMKRDESGIHRLDVPLTPGTDVQFKFVVDGVWMVNLDYDTTYDAHGNWNNVTHVNPIASLPPRKSSKGNRTNPFKSENKSRRGKQDKDEFDDGLKDDGAGKEEKKKHDKKEPNHDSISRGDSKTAKWQKDIKD